MKAWHEGYNAFMADVNSECPYVQDTQQSDDWIDGFLTASYKVRN